MEHAEQSTQPTRAQRAELILNLLQLDTAQQEAFSSLGAGYEQLFAPGGKLPDGSPVPPEAYRRATIILGSPRPEQLRGNTALRFLQARTAGVEQYMVPGVLPEGAVLRSASGAYGHSVGEHMFAMLLALMKRLPAYRDRQRAGSWTDLGPVKSVAGAKVLCIGTGDLGSTFAGLCKALGAETLGIRRDSTRGAPGIDAMYGMQALDALLPQADVVTLMLPNSAETVHLIDARRLRLMKPDAILLNGGRGTAIDCAALAQALSEGLLWGAGLDVTDPEPLPPEHPLWQEPRALITPHTAGWDHLPDTAGRIAAIALKNLRDYLAQR